MRRGLAELVVVLAVAFLWHAAYSGYGLAPQDEGWLLNAASRVAAGETPYRDFTTAYVPGTYWLVAGVLDVLGPNLPAVRLLFALLRALTVLLVFLLARRVTSRPFALGAAALTALVPGPWHKTFYALVPLAALVPAARWESGGSLRWLAAAGCAAGVGAWFRQDAGFAALAGAAWITWWAARSRAAASRRRALGVLVLSAAAAFSVPAAWLAARGVTAGDVLAQSGTGAVAVGAPRAYWLTSLLRLSAPDLAPPHAQIVAVLALSLPALAVLGLHRSFARRRLAQPSAATLGGLALATLLLSNQVFREHVIVRFLQCGPLAYVLFFTLTAAARPLARGTLLAVPAAFAAYVLLAEGARGDIPVEYTGSVVVRAGANATLDVRGHVLHVRENLAADLAPLAGFVRERTAEGEPILVLGAPAILNFLADRPSPDRRIRIGREHLPRLDLDFWRHVYASGCRHVVMPRSWGDLGPLEIYPTGRRPEVLRRFGSWAVWRLP